MNEYAEFLRGRMCIAIFSVRQFMENSNLVLIDGATDLTKEEIERVQKFVNDGLPGISSISEDKIQRMAEMYLSGYSTSRIARCFSCKKEIVLYLSHKFCWYQAKKEYQLDLQVRMQARIVEARLIGKDYLLQLTSYLQTTVGQKILKAMTTGDESQGPDAKMIDRSLKALEALLKLTDAQEQKTVAIPLRIERSSQAVNIDEANTGDRLRMYADMRRAQEAEIRLKKKIID